MGTRTFRRTSGMWEGIGLCRPGAQGTCVQVGGHLAELLRTCNFLQRNWPRDIDAVTWES